ncbi:MAG: agmatinase [Bacteroidia bacterium]|nr:MAG: agmatinase [Bacteroidia bacterium]
MNNTTTFGGIPLKYGEYSNSDILLQSIPYDGTSTWGKGADKGFQNFLEAAENMELYDIETDSEVYKKGIHILPPVLEKKNPESVYKAVFQQTKKLLQTDKFLTFFGGEHSVSIGIIDAFAQHYGKNLTVLQLDAHADLRPQYLGSEFNHACAMYRASLQTNLIQIGIRSMDVEEKQYMNLKNCFFAEQMHKQTDWQEQSLDQMTDKVYLSIDLDFFDPSIMPSTGTPEPGGGDWHTSLQYLRRVFQEKNIVGFDIVEFAPIKGLRHPDFLVSKLYYKLLSYKFYGK